MRGDLVSKTEATACRYGLLAGLARLQRRNQRCGRRLSSGLVRYRECAASGTRTVSILARRFVSISIAKPLTSRSTSCSTR